MRLAGAPLALGTLAAALVLAASCSSSYAVDGMLDLAERATSAEVIAAMRGRVVGHGSLTGTYRREE